MSDLSKKINTDTSVGIVEIAGFFCFCAGKLHFSFSFSLAFGNSRLSFRLRKIVTPPPTTTSSALQWSSRERGAEHA